MPGRVNPRFTRDHLEEGRADGKNHHIARVLRVSSEAASRLPGVIPVSQLSVEDQAWWRSHAHPYMRSCRCCGRPANLERRQLDSVSE